ncbi:PEP/pyruvate-binding domain-containing protein [Desulfobacula sp.]|uniref:PEP/pyruvate-binding domain-containing protein n=1 Tax=Desulfobacula sp. TaxID=2593537 RepID=UPI0026361B9A|nr:PEP/pyruvate-binding domain-containing protein [Desulfobacula sp.]
MTDGNEWIKFFEECGRNDTSLVGGKCANLGEMCKIGVPVPPGFAITTKVYDTFLNATNIAGKIKKYIDESISNPTTMEELNKMANDLQSFILAGEIPEEQSAAISDAYDSLCQKLGISDVAVAVRSSGVAEDSATASFAGQYESYLNVIGKESLFKNIKECWASAFSPRCISYRIHNGLGLFAGSISVAVQKMAKSRSAGVGFTANPNTGDRGKIVIEGNWGTGESVVQGISKVDIFSVSKETLEIVEQQINKKTRQIVIKEKGILEMEIPENQQSLPCLEPEEVKLLAKIARDTELHYGVPLDIEWAVDVELEFPDNIFLVQARPITAIIEKKSSTETILDMACSRLFPSKI